MYTAYAPVGNTASSIATAMQRIASATFDLSQLHWGNYA